MRRLFVLAALSSLFTACIPAPMRPVGEFQQVDLHACYLWNYPSGAPPAGDPSTGYFILSDGSPSFRQIEWGGTTVDSARSKGCDVAMTMGFSMSGFATVHWDSRVYSVPSGREIADVRSEGGTNFSIQAVAVYRALKPGTEAYRIAKEDAAAMAVRDRPGSRHRSPLLTVVAEDKPAPAAAAPASSYQQPDVPEPPRGQRPPPATPSEAAAELLP